MRHSGPGVRNKHPGLERCRPGRLHFAVLRLSDGRLDRLQAAVNNAKRDFRDVLMAADFGEPDSYIRWTPKAEMVTSVWLLFFGFLLGFEI